MNASPHTRTALLVWLAATFFVAAAAVARRRRRPPSSLRIASRRFCIDFNFAPGRRELFRPAGRVRPRRPEGALWVVQRPGPNAMAAVRSRLRRVCPVPDMAAAPVEPGLRHDFLEGDYGNWPTRTA